MAHVALIEEGLFDLGRVVITAGADAHVKFSQALGLLSRHVSGDWGEVDDDEDKAANIGAVTFGDRILSVYTAVDGTKVWIITEADRSTTTILLPDEY